MQPPLPIADHVLLLFLMQVSLLLVAARLLGALATRLGMPAVVGELLVGVLLGPSVLQNVLPGLSDLLFPARAEQFHLLDAVGQLGVLLLVGVAGMQLDMGLVRRRGRSAAAVSVAGLVVPLGFGVAIGLAAPATLRPADTDPVVFAQFMGVAICVSAIPVIAKTLMEMRLTHRNVGQLILTAGMIDDTVGWFLLSVVSAMATGGVQVRGVLTSVALLAAIGLVTVSVGRWVVRGVMRAADRSVEPSAVTAAAVALVLLGATGTHALGFEAVLGAILCGALIGSSGVDMAKLVPLNRAVMSVLAPIFFATAGLRMDLTALWDLELALAALVVLVLAIAGKFLGAFVGAMASRLTRWEAVALGAGMNARGVIQIIIAAVGLRLGVLGTEAYTILVLVAVVTSVMAPPLLRLAMRRIEMTAEEELRGHKMRIWLDRGDELPRSG